MFSVKLAEIIISVIILAGISGCYGDINIDKKLMAQGVYDSDSVNLYFFHSEEVNRPADGINYVRYILFISVNTRPFYQPAHKTRDSRPFMIARESPAKLKP